MASRKVHGRLYAKRLTDLDEGSYLDKPLKNHTKVNVLRFLCKPTFGREYR